MPVSVDDVIEALRPVEDPELHRSIIDLGMVRDVQVDGTSVALEVTLTVAGCPLRNEIQSRVTGALNGIGVETVDLSFGVMTDEQRAELRQKLHGDPSATAGSQQAHGHAEGRAIPFADPDSKTRVLLIASGKGGVGKSTVTTNLSVALAQRGHSVAVVDADVWGFSIPRMLGVEHPPAVIDSMLVPPTGAGGVRCISMGFFAKEDQPVIWRGPMLHKALEQFLTDVFWDDPDFLLVDLPPGTGDISLSLGPVPAPQRGVHRHHPPACGPARRSAGRVHGPEGEPRGEGHHREHVLVHRRRRQALRALRRGWRRRAVRAPRCSPPRPGAARERAPGRRRLRSTDRASPTPTARPRRCSDGSPTASQSTWRPHAATARSSSSCNTRASGVAGAPASARASRRPASRIAFGLPVTRVLRRTRVLRASLAPCLSDRRAG